MPASATRPELSALERVNLLEQLQQQEAERRRKTAVSAWGSVGLATLVLAILVFGAWSYVKDARTKVRELNQEYSENMKEFEELKRNKTAVAEELAKLQAQLKEAKAQQALLTQTLGSVPQEQRQAALEYQFKADPKAAEVLPRAYVQIVDPNDREWAKDVSRRLEKAGIVVAGIEYVPKAAGLKDTDVRFYKKSESEGAERIARVLESAGIKVRLNYLNQEDNTKVRPNHFEIWFAAGARNIPLRQPSLREPLSGATISPSQ